MALQPRQQYLQLARTLPPQLTRFFARYPPAGLQPQSVTPPSPSTSPTASTTSPSSIQSSSEAQTNTVATNPPSPSELLQQQLNPFQPQKDPNTGRWHDPVYSLRRQADLVKLARKHGVEELLPFTVKGTEERLRKRLEFGLRVKGTGVGERVKGKSDERTLKSKLEKRRQAMLAMPQMIQEWKMRGHGRGWKKWPKP